MLRESAQGEGSGDEIATKRQTKRGNVSMTGVNQTRSPHDAVTFKKKVSCLRRPN